jgi:hypothetical protein
MDQDTIVKWVLGIVIGGLILGPSGLGIIDVGQEGGVF